MPTDSAILSQRQTLWGEPITATTPEADVESAIVASEFLPRPITSAGGVDSPVTWDASTAELIDWFQSQWERLPIEPFGLKPGVRVVDAVLFYRSLNTDISSGPTRPRAKYGGLVDDLKNLRSAVRA